MSAEDVVSVRWNSGRQRASIIYSLCFGENGVLCKRQVERVLNPDVQV